MKPHIGSEVKFIEFISPVRSEIIIIIIIIIIIYGIYIALYPDAQSALQHFVGK